MSISILMCVYEKDDAYYFKEAFLSMVNQSMLADEFVLVEDGPIGGVLSNMVQCLKEHCEDKGILFKKVSLIENCGHGAARRAGVLECSCEYIAISDSDDIYEFHRLKVLYEVFSVDSELSVVGSQILEVEHDTLECLGFRNVPLKHSDIVNTLKYKCPLNQMSVLIKRQDLVSAGSYMHFYHNEDYYLWIRMFIEGAKFHNVSNVLVKARVNAHFYDRRGGKEYFLSELNIQKFMLENKIINFPQYIFNVFVRYILQVVLTDKIRGIIFKKLFRGKVRV